MKLTFNYKCLLENINQDVKNLRERERESQIESIDKFVISNIKIIMENLDENLINE